MKAFLQPSEGNFQNQKRTKKADCANNRTQKIRLSHVIFIFLYSLKKHLEEMKNKTYEESMARLEEITKKIEARELTIDELSNNLKEAQQLLKFCKDKLYKTDEDIQKILDKAEDI